MQTHYKPTETFLQGSPTRHEKTLHQRGSAQASKDLFLADHIRQDFHNRLLERGYPCRYFSEEVPLRGKICRQENSPTTERQIRTQKTSTLCYTIPALLSLKKMLMGKWHLIQNQQRLRAIFKEPPLIPYREGKSLKDLPVRANLWRSYYFQYDLVQEWCDAHLPGPSLIFNHKSAQKFIYYIRRKQESLLKNMYENTPQWRHSFFYKCEFW